jgi:hypothetical protein
MSRLLPMDLEDTYAWVDAAGELKTLARMGGREAVRYATDCEQNFATTQNDNGAWASSYITGDTVLELWKLLSAQCADGTFTIEHGNSRSVHGGTS